LQKLDGEGGVKAVEVEHVQQALTEQAQQRPVRTRFFSLQRLQGDYGRLDVIVHE